MISSRPGASPNLTLRSILAGLLALGLWATTPGSANAQSLVGCPYLQFGVVLTPAQWQQCFETKQDYLGSPPLLLSGGTMLGKLTTAPSTSIAAGFSIPPGGPPNTPQNGDLWETNVGIFARIGGVTYQLSAVSPFSGVLQVIDGGTGGNSWLPGLALIGNGTLPLQQSTIVTSISSSDGTLTISPSENAVLAGINLAHSNLWQAPQSFVSPTSAQSGLNIGQGTSPTQPSGGDLWLTGSGAFARFGNQTWQFVVEGTTSAGIIAGNGYGVTSKGSGGIVAINGASTTSGGSGITGVNEVSPVATTPNVGTLASGLILPSPILTGMVSIPESVNVGSSIDATGQTGVSVTNGSNVALSIAATNGYGFVYLCETLVTHDCAHYMVADGTVALIASVLGDWVSPTTTPSSGKFSLQSNAGVYTVYNNQGGTISVHAFSVRE